MRILVIAGALLVVVGVVLALVSGRQKEVPKELLEKKEEPSFVPRRTSADIEKGLSELRKSRGGTPTEIAVTKVEEAKAKAFWQKELSLQQQSPEQVRKDGARKLEEIDAQLTSTTDPVERERLERQKKLIGEVLTKLGKMAEGRR